MSATATAPVTPDELLQMPDEGAGYELVNGELKELAVSNESSRIAGRVCSRLDVYCESRQPGWVFPEGVSFRCFPDDPDRVRRADTAYIALDRMTPEQYRRRGHCTISPDLAVEVTSPTDNHDDVEEKLGDWLGAGALIVWIIHPPSQTVRVHRADGTYSFLWAADTLTAPDLLPGFAVPVADLFRLPGEPRPA
ncbi:MAG: Uma2 family endonuclease [Fimbriiglobus sp.]